MLRHFSVHHDVIGIWHVPKIVVRNRTPDTKPWFVQMNDAGMRDDRDFSERKSPDVDRITLLGDSFTFGYSVEVAQRYSNRIEAKFDGLEVLNFGLPSAGIDQQYLVYEQIASAYESDILMINPYLNNVGRCQLAYHMFQGRDGKPRMTAKPYFELEGSDLVLKNVPVVRNPKGEDAQRLQQAQAGRANTRNVEADPHKGLTRIVRQSLLSRNFKYLMIKLLPVTPYAEYRSADAPEWQLARRILQELRSISKQEHMVITPLPAWSTILNPKLAIYRERFAELHDPGAGVHVFDILPYFEALSFAERVKCFVSPRDTHYSAFGHQVAAEGIADELTRSGLLTRAKRR